MCIVVDDLQYRKFAASQLRQVIGVMQSGREQRGLDQVNSDDRVLHHCLQCVILQTAGPRTTRIELGRRGLRGWHGRSEVSTTPTACAGVQKKGQSLR